MNLVFRIGIITNMKLVLAILLSIISVLGCNTGVLAAQSDYKNTTSIILQKDQVINKDYFAGGDTVTILGTVNGDAYVAGGTVYVDGTINGDLLVAGGTVNIRGKVSNNIRAVGGQIIVSGKTGRNLTTLGGSVTITETASVSGSLVAGAGTLSVFAPIGTDASIGAGQVTIDSHITRDVQAGVGTISLTPNAKIGGNFTYWSSETAQVTAPSQVAGKITHNYPPTPEKEQPQKDTSPFVIAGLVSTFSLFSFCSALLIGLLMLKFIPVYTKQIVVLMQEKMLQSFGVGFLSIVLAPFIFVILLITLIGIPLSIISFVLFGILIYLAKIIFSMVLGEKIFVQLNKKAARGWTFLVGLILYYLITMIPVFGFVVWLIAGCMGLGALLMQAQYAYTTLRHKNLI